MGKVFQMFFIMQYKKEVWRDVDGYGGLYQISNKGRVKSFNVDSKGALLKIYLDRYGYEYVALSTKKYKVHRLVAKAFIPNPKNKKTVNHKNEIKTDNRAINLEWMTVREQNHYSISTPVFIFINEEIRRFPSVSDAAKELDCTTDKIIALNKDFESVLRLSQSVLNSAPSFKKNYKYVDSHKDCEGINEKENHFLLRLTINGKREHLGEFDTLQEAIDKRNDVIIKYGLKYKICILKESNEKIKDNLYSSLRFLNEHIISNYKNDDLAANFISSINKSLEKLCS